MLGTKTLFMAFCALSEAKGMDIKMLEYISAPEAAQKWGISERRVQKLCEENRIPGVAKFSRLWLIPKDAEKPTDARLKAERKKKHE